MRAISDLEGKVIESDKVTIMSMDASALFPSLHLQDILDGIWRLVMDTSLELKNIDFKEVAKYLVVSYDIGDLQKVNIVSCLPKRQVDIDGTARNRLTLAFLDSDYYTRSVNGRKEKNVPIWNWSQYQSSSDIQKGRCLPWL